MSNLSNHFRRSDPRLTSANGAGPDGTRFVITSKNFANTAIGDLQDARNVTWPSTTVGKLNYSLSCGVGQGTAINKDPSQLVYPTVPYKNRKEQSYSLKYILFNKHLFITNFIFYYRFYLYYFIFLEVGTSTIGICISFFYLQRITLII